MQRVRDDLRRGTGVRRHHEFELDGVALRVTPLGEGDEVGRPYVLKDLGMFEPLRLRVTQTLINGLHVHYGAGHYTMTAPAPEVDVRLVVPHRKKDEVPLGACRMEFWTARKPNGRQSPVRPYWMFTFENALLWRETGSNVFSGRAFGEETSGVKFWCASESCLPREEALTFDI